MIIPNYFESWVQTNWRSRRVSAYCQRIRKWIRKWWQQKWGDWGRKYCRRNRTSFRKFWFNIWNFRSRISKIWTFEKFFATQFAPLNFRRGKTGKFISQTKKWKSSKSNKNNRGRRGSRKTEKWRNFKGWKFDIFRRSWRRKSSDST